MPDPARTGPTCPECGQPLSTGLEEPSQRLGRPDRVPPRLQCVACGWSSASDQPGTLGGDNGGG